MERAFPEGTATFQFELAPSGHLVFPCCEFQKGSTADEHSLTFVTRSQPAPQQPCSSSSPIPPAPAAPPVLPEAVRRPTVLAPPPLNA
eukprot:11005509-Lingulodinium_polyedra.AAC.1